MKHSPAVGYATSSPSVARHSCTVSPDPLQNPCFRSFRVSITEAEANGPAAPAPHDRTGCEGFLICSRMGRSYLLLVLAMADSAGVAGVVSQRSDPCGAWRRGGKSEIPEPGEEESEGSEGFSNLSSNMGGGWIPCSGHWCASSTAWTPPPGMTVNGILPS